MKTLISSRLKRIDLPKELKDPLEISVDEINKVCGVFRNIEGGLNKLGKQRLKLLSNFYSFQNDEPCDKVDWLQLNTQLFYSKYLFPSKPVVLKNFANDWKAMKRWTNLHFFADGKIGEKSVHVKLSPTNNYEGVEPREWWGRDEIPSEVLQHLQFPELVVVRPASAEMKMKEVCRVFQQINFN